MGPVLVRFGNLPHFSLSDYMASKGTQMSPATVHDRMTEATASLEKIKKKASADRLYTIVDKAKDTLPSRQKVADIKFKCFATQNQLEKNSLALSQISKATEKLKIDTLVLAKIRNKLRTNKAIAQKRLEQLRTSALCTFTGLRKKLKEWKSSLSVRKKRESCR
eukprot:m.168663 g.168663  ORF g.168663 m.168663 type:complete len:164 (+) comp38964_c0_seq11:1041-1532(+)